MDKLPKEKLDLPNCPNCEGFSMIGMIDDEDEDKIIYKCPICQHTIIPDSKKS